MKIGVRSGDSESNSKIASPIPKTVADSEDSESDSEDSSIPKTVPAVTVLRVAF
jgi:hypothetical protein